MSQWQATKCLPKAVIHTVWYVCASRIKFEITYYKTIFTPILHQVQSTILQISGRMARHPKVNTSLLNVFPWSLNIKIEISTKQATYTEDYKKSTRKYTIFTHAFIHFKNCVSYDLCMIKMKLNSLSLCCFCLHKCMKILLCIAVSHS